MIADLFSESVWNTFGEVIAIVAILVVLIWAVWWVCQEFR